MSYKLMFYSMFMGKCVCLSIVLTIQHLIWLLLFFSMGTTRAFGYSSEDVQMVIESMAAQGKEPTFCMGDDIPLAALSQKPHMLFDYFKQRFAQAS